MNVIDTREHIKDRDVLGNLSALLLHFLLISFSSKSLFLIYHALGAILGAILRAILNIISFLSHLIIFYKTKEPIVDSLKILCVCNSTFSLRYYYSPYTFFRVPFCFLRSIKQRADKFFYPIHCFWHRYLNKCFFLFQEGLPSCLIVIL